MLACDGFWDVLDGQEAVDHALEFLAAGLNPTEAAARLGNLALRLGSSDNITVVLIVFDHNGGGARGIGGGGEGEIVVEKGDEDGERIRGGDVGKGEGGEERTTTAPP